MNGCCIVRLYTHISGSGGMTLISYIHPVTAPLDIYSFDFWLIKICWYMCKWCALGAREEKCGCCIKHYTLLFHTSLTYSTDLIVLIGASEQSVCLVVSVNCESWISWQQKISNSAMTIIFGERQFWLWIWLFWISK